MIYGIGVDNCDIERFSAQISGSCELLERLFAPSERDMPMSSLAARFAAKEALIKAFGGLRVRDVSLTLQDIVIPRVPGERPAYQLTPALQAALDAIGADRIHLSLTHDGGIATAMAIIEKAI